MRHTLLTHVTELQRLAKFVSLVIAAVGGWLSFLGYRELLAESGQPTAIVTFTAALLAIACGAILHLFYTAVLGGIPAVDRKPRGKFIPIIAVLAAFVLCFATYGSVVTTGGPEALRVHTARIVDRLIDAGTALQVAVLSIGQLAPELQMRADNFKTKAKCEAEKGCLTGAPSAGDLVNALTQAHDKVGTAATSLARASAAIAELTPKLNATFAAGDDIAARSLLAQIRAAVPFDTMKAIAADLRADLEIQGSAKSAAVRARQNEAIRQLQGELASIADVLDQAMARLRTELDAVTLPERETITKAKAILLHYDEILPQIALSVSIDLVLIGIAFLMAMFRDATPKPEDDVSDISIADARRIQRELKKLIATMAREEVEQPRPRVLH
jgi:hypothetical protein